MANNDIVSIQIQPEILDVDTTEVTKNLKSRFAELQNEMTKIVTQVSNSATITPVVESALKKVISPPTVFAYFNIFCPLQMKYSPVPS